MFARVRILTTILLLLGLGAAVLRADDDDQAQARRARAAGEIVALETILAAVEAEFRGQVVEVELEREDGGWEYEIELLAADGRIVELTYDASSGRLLEVEGAGAAQARRTPR